MSYLDAAVAVLSAAERPLTTAEITKEALALGLIQPHGRTPEATMSSVLYVHLLEHPTDGRIIRMARAGAKRAQRGTVRWWVSDQRDRSKKRASRNVDRKAVSADR